MPNSTSEDFVRVKRLANAIEDRDYIVSEINEKFPPDSHGCHKAMHLASVINDLVDERLYNDPASNAEWYWLAATAQEALWNLYQATSIWELELSQEIQIRDITQYYTDGQ